MAAKPGFRRVQWVCQSRNFRLAPLLTYQPHRTAQGSRKSGSFFLYTFVGKHHGILRTEVSISETVCLGTSVEVFGTITPASNGNPISLYQIDDDPITSFTTPAVDDTAYRYKLYASPILPPGTHTINVTVLWSTGTVFWFDYLVYNASAQATTDTTAHTPSASAHLITSAMPISSSPVTPVALTMSTTPYDTPPSGKSSSSANHSNVALVAGIAVSSALGSVLLAIILVAWLCRRRDSRKRKDEHIRPFTVDRLPAGMALCLIFSENSSNHCSADHSRVSNPPSQKTLRS